MATKKRVTKKATGTAKGRAAKKPAAKKPAAKKPATKKPEGKTSALDAAAKILSESKEPLTTKEMVEAMSAKGYWKTKTGKTPDRTLYSAILREIVIKKGQSRFQKTQRGKFTLKKKN